MTKEINVTDEQAEEALKDMLGWGEQTTTQEMKSEEVIDTPKSDEPETKVEEPKEGEGEEAWKSKEKGNPEKRYQKLLRQRNEAREEAKKANDRLDKLKKGDYTKEEYGSDRDADMAVVESQSEKTYSDKRAASLDAEMKDSFFEEMPSANKHKDGIMDLMNNKPDLSIDEAHKLYLAMNFPDQLYDKHKLRQKSDNGMIGSGTKWIEWKQKHGFDKVNKMSAKDLNKLSTAELDAHLNEAIAKWNSLI